MDSYQLLQKYISDYFSDMSIADLEKNIFPKYPELFSEIAKYREHGIPKAYKIHLDKPVNPRMFFFESNLGKQYTGNPRYIYERMLERYPDYTYIWCYGGTEKIPGNPIIVERSSEEYYRLLALSKYIINNTTFALWYHRPETFYLQTWHGTPFKKLHYDMDRPLEKRSTPHAYAKSTQWSALLSPNRYSTDKFKSAFKYNGPIVETGYPANDIFYDKKRYEQVREKVRRRFNIDSDAPVFLYAPTWRDGKHLGNSMFAFDLLLDTEEFIKHAPDNAVLLVRSHHMSKSDDELKNLKGQVIDVSQFDDAIELMCASDVLITDYSSIVFDWYCSRKPVIYFVPDYDKYANLRGSYFDLKDNKAGEICITQTELFNCISSINPRETTSYSSFYSQFCYLHDGTSTDKVIDYLLSQK
ncbi:CDP-glycerol glycerophosphotransferase family protein [Bacillus cereus]|uniref:CDP-glycerol glycerophosphotransferase family protein n=1 Tax=Bacillus cereus TaxID=1396 RepID=UPI00356C4DDB